MKNKLRIIIALAVLFVVYTVVVFVVPFTKNAVFAISYIFAVIAMGAQIYVFHTAFSREDTVRSRFYGFPIARLGIIYLVVQLVISLVLMAVAAIAPTWLTVIVCLVLLGVFAIGFIAADAAREEVVRQDVTLEKKVSRIRSLQATAATLPKMTENAELKKALQLLAEELRYSDPVSSEATEEVETELECYIQKISAGITENKSEATELCDKARKLLVTRNQLCKLGKKQ